MPEMFLKFHDIEGESLDEVHRGEIEIKSWAWSAKAIVSWERNQGGQCSKTWYEKVAIEKCVDKASATLLQCCLTGRHIRHATITCRKNDGEQKLEYLVVKLKDVMVSLVKWAGAGEETQLPESIELQCAEIENTYKPQKDSGDTDGKLSFGYNIQTQVAT